MTCRLTTAACTQVEEVPTRRVSMQRGPLAPVITDGVESTVWRGTSPGPHKAAPWGAPASTHLRSDSLSSAASSPMCRNTLPQRVPREMLGTEGGPEFAKSEQQVLRKNAQRSGEFAGGRVRVTG